MDGDVGERQIYLSVGAHRAALAIKAVIRRRAKATG